MIDVDALLRENAELREQLAKLNDRVAGLDILFDALAIPGRNSYLDSPFWA